MRPYFVIFLVFAPFLAFAQPKAATFQQAVAQGISIEKLDSMYLSAIHSDSTKAVFRSNEGEFIDSYRTLLRDLGAYLKKNDFKWAARTKCFNRIYFKADGTIDYFLFNFYPNQIDREKEAQFARLLSEFIQHYQFPLKAKVNFAQCSPVTYSD